MGKILFIIGIIVVMMILPALRKSGRRTHRSGATGGLRWFGGRKKRVSELVWGGSGTNTNGYFPPQPVYAGDSEIEKVVKAHADCTAEVVDLTIIGRKKVDRTYSMYPGDPVLLKKYGNMIKVFGKITGTSVEFYVDDIYPPAGSILPKLFDENIPFEAYLGSRDIYADSEEFSFLKLLVFYRIEGIPPTKINLHF